MHVNGGGCTLQRANATSSRLRHSCGDQHGHRVNANRNTAILRHLHPVTPSNCLRPVFDLVFDLVGLWGTAAMQTMRQVGSDCQWRRREGPARSSGQQRRCRVRPSAVVAGGKVYIDPVKQECTAFAPATVANLGPGFDWLGCAVEVGFQWLIVAPGARH